MSKTFQRFLNNALGIFMIAHNDKEHPALFFCAVAELQRKFVDAR